MKAHIAATELKPEEWKGCQKYDLFLQKSRVCGQKIYSHMSIVFTNVDRNLANSHLDSRFTRPEVRGSKEIVFESLQEPKPYGFVGLSTIQGPRSWYTQWNSPAVSYFELDRRIDPRTLFLAALEYTRSGRTYSWDWATQAAYAPCLPCIRCTCSCDSRDPTTNCVGAVLSVVAGALDEDALFDRSHTKRVLGLSRSYPELLFPSEALAALQKMELIPKTPWKIRIVYRGVSTDQAPIPALLIRR